jgi:hypothetical protein
LPLKTFWLLFKNIDRIEGTADLRNAQIAARSQSAELMKELFTKLQDQVGRIIVIDQGKAAMKVEKTDKAALKVFAAKYGKAV